MSDHDIKQDENVKLVTSKKDGQQYADHLNGSKSILSGQGFQPSSDPKHTHSTRFRLGQDTVETFNPDVALQRKPQETYSGEPVVNIPQMQADMLQSIQSDQTGYQQSKSPSSSNGFKPTMPLEKQFSKTQHSSPKNEKADQFDDTLQITPITYQAPQPKTNKKVSSINKTKSRSSSKKLIYAGRKPSQLDIQIQNSTKLDPIEMSPRTDGENSKNVSDASPTNGRIS